MPYHQCNKLLHIVLNFRTNRKQYKDERKRQKMWVPVNVPGKIKDIILDPHLRQGIAAIKDCPICKKNFSNDHVMPEKDRKMLERAAKKFQVFNKKSES